MTPIPTELGIGGVFKFREECVCAVECDRAHVSRILNVNVISCILEISLELNLNLVNNRLVFVVLTVMWNVDGITCTRLSHLSSL